MTPLRALPASAPVLRTPEDLARDATRVAPTVAVAQASLINRPTIPMADYRAAKAGGAAMRGFGKPVEPDAPPTLKAKNFNGVSQNQAGGSFPPDTHGAAGPMHFFEITNQHVDIYRKSDGVRVNGGGSGVSLANFFGYFAQALFDPQAIYDIGEGRWVVTAEAFPESATVQRFFLAVSQTSNPLGSYFVYSLDVELGSGNFFDYPHLGEDAGAALVTANEFFGTGGVEAWLLVWPKNTTYVGAFTTVTIFGGLIETAMPPIVIDNKATSFIASAPPVSSTLKLYTLRNSDDPATVSLTGPANVSVPAYSVPPNAEQPAPCGAASNDLDTLDARFQNAGTQNGNNLFQVHTINMGGFPVNKYYRINTNSKTVAASDVFFATATSFDFNPSIAANAANDVYITWSVTDPPAGTDAQVRISGRRAADPPAIPAGSGIFTSTACLTGNFDPNRGFQRWGDYSAVSLDPSALANRAWIVNEKINNANTWGSRFARIGF